MRRYMKHGRHELGLKAGWWPLGFAGLLSEGYGGMYCSQREPGGSIFL